MQLSELKATRWPSPWRWAIAFAVALVLHLAMLWALWAIEWLPQAKEPTRLNLTLSRTLTPEPVVVTPIQPVDEVESQVEASPPEPQLVEAVDPAEQKPAPQPVVVQAKPEVVPDRPVVTTTQILRHIAKYRLHDDRLLVSLPPEPAEPLSLGHINRQDLLAMLDKPLPRLPFADPDTPFVFYSTGFEGKIEKFIDKITKRTSHTTKWGTKIECAYTLIFVVCGWG